jgi:hypothetical protein
MIGRRTLGILAVALLVMIGLAWMTSQRRNAAVPGGGFVDVLPGVDAGRISILRAWLGESTDDAIELQRSSDGWIVASAWGWKAKDDLVQSLLDDLAGLSGESRSTSPDVLADYEIDDETGLHVTAQGDAGSELFHLVVGKASNRGGCFVRRAGSDEVLLTSASLRSSFGVWGDDPKPPESKRWIDLRIHKAERNDVDEVVITDGGKPLTLEKVFEEPAEEGGEVDRTKWTWKPDAAGEFDKGKTDGLVSTLCNLYANDVVEPGDLDRYGLGEDARRAELTFHDGTTTKIWFGSTKADDDKFVYVRVGDEGDPAEIYKSTVDRVFLDRSELKPKEG